MDHRLFAVLGIVCLALEGAGCASQSQIENREEVLMPLQTGSLLQRRVMMTKEPETKKTKKKKEKKEAKEKKETKEPEEAKRPSSKPTPAPTPEPTPERPVEESTPAPDRFR
jgi:outer membrane biosynthesis protein TonB